MAQEIESPDVSALGPFMAANAAIHAELEERYLTFLERLTELRLDDATQEFEALMQLLHAHVDVEEKHILPHFVSVLAPEGASDDEREVARKTAQLVDGDHLILSRTEASMRAALEGMGSAPSRRDLVRGLETFLRFGRVLEHHTDREQRTLYPRLDEAQNADSQPLLQALRAVLA